MDMNENKKKVQELLARVRDILTDTLTTNDEIKKVMKELEDIGFRVNLNFIALVGSKGQPLPGMPPPFIMKQAFGLQEQSEEAEISTELSDKDIEFLKNIGIEPPDIGPRHDDEEDDENEPDFDEEEDDSGFDIDEDDDEDETE